MKTIRVSGETGKYVRGERYRQESSRSVVGEALIRKGDVDGFRAHANLDSKGVYSYLIPVPAAPVGYVIVDFARPDGSVPHLQLDGIPTHGASTYLYDDARVGTKRFLLRRTAFEEIAGKAFEIYRRDGNENRSGVYVACGTQEASDGSDGILFRTYFPNPDESAKTDTGAIPLHGEHYNWSAVLTTAAGKQYSGTGTYLGYNPHTESHLFRRLENESILHMDTGQMSMLCATQDDDKTFGCNLAVGAYYRILHPHGATSCGILKNWHEHIQQYTFVSRGVETIYGEEYLRGCALTRLDGYDVLDTRGHPMVRCETYSVNGAGPQKLVDIDRGGNYLFVTERSTLVWSQHYLELRDMTIKHCASAEVHVGKTGMRLSDGNSYQITHPNGTAYTGQYLGWSDREELHCFGEGAKATDFYTTAFLRECKVTPHTPLTTEPVGWSDGDCSAYLNDLGTHFGTLELTLRIEGEGLRARAQRAREWLQAEYGTDNIGKAAEMLSEAELKHTTLVAKREALPKRGHVQNLGDDTRKMGAL